MNFIPSFKPISLYEELLFSTVMIKTNTPDGKKSGTGFFFNYQFKENRAMPFIVTNRHVVKDATSGDFIFHVKNPDDDFTILESPLNYHIDNFGKRWTFHDNPHIDIALMPFLPLMNDVFTQTKKQIFYKTIPSNFIPTEDDIKDKIDAIEEIIFLGYPKGILDEKHFLPIVRRGITATAINFDFNGKPKFLIDSAVFPGSSGSPVFICNMGSYSTRGKGLTVGNRIFFLGILSAMIISKNSLEYIPSPTVQVPNLKYNQLLNLGHVYKSFLILEMIRQRIDKGIFKISTP